MIQQKIELNFDVSMYRTSLIKFKYLKTKKFIELLANQLVFVLSKKKVKKRNKH